MAFVEEISANIRALNHAPKFFSNTVAELHSEVTAKIRSTLNSIEQIRRCCTYAQVTLIDDNGVLQLQGDWSKLCEARWKILQILQLPCLGKNSEQSKRGITTATRLGKYYRTFTSRQCLKRKNRIQYQVSLQKLPQSLRHRCNTCNRVFAHRRTLISHECRSISRVSASATNGENYALTAPEGDDLSSGKQTCSPCLGTGTTSAESPIDVIKVSTHTDQIMEISTISNDTNRENFETCDSNICSSVDYPTMQNTSVPAQTVTPTETVIKQKVPSKCFSCTQCSQRFKTKAELVKHIKFHGNSASRKPCEPEGDLTEVCELSTPEFRVVSDSCGVRWYECRVCLLRGSRRFLMATHYKLNHSENTSVPFKISTKGVESENSKENTNIQSLENDNVESSVTESSFPQASPKSRLNTKHQEKMTEECQKCGFVTSAAGLRSHMRTDHKQSLYMCKICDKSFPTLLTLRSHNHKHKKATLNTEINSKPGSDESFQCQKCGKNFSRKVDLVHHKVLGRSCSEKEQDPKVYNPPFADGKYICEVCDYTALQRVHVVQHHARKHALKEFHCQQCSQSFAYERDLKKHLTISHAEQKAYKCIECNKAFACAKYLTAHQLRHDKVKKHFCPTCGRGFLEKYRMLNHFETHKLQADRKKPFHCSICDRGFSSKSYRNDHENIHKGEAPYSCKICGKNMKAQCHMWKHEKVHHCGKEHQCPVCKKLFRFKAGLNAHSVTHTRMGKHACSKCGKVYTQKQTLQRHVCKSESSTEQSMDTDDTDIAAQTIAAPPEANTLTETELEASSVQQNVYMCSECNTVFYDWNEINDHMLTHNVTPNTDIEHSKIDIDDLPVLETNDYSSFTIQILDTPEIVDPTVQSSDANVGVVNIMSTEPTKNITRDVIIPQNNVISQETNASTGDWSQLNVDSVESNAPIVFVDAQSISQVHTTSGNYIQSSTETTQ